MKHIVNIFFNHTGEVQLTKGDQRTMYKLGSKVKIGAHTLVVTLGSDNRPVALVDNAPGAVTEISDNEHGFGFRIDIEVDPVASMSEWASKFGPKKAT